MLARAKAAERVQLVEADALALPFAERQPRRRDHRLGAQERSGTWTIRRGESQAWCACSRPEAGLPSCELLAFTAAEIRSMHAIGSKTASDVIAFQESLRARGLGPSTTPAKLEPLLLEELRRLLLFRMG